MKIISDSSPLINMACIGRLDLLKQLYGQLFVPEAVQNEIVIVGKGQPGADEIESAKWIKMKSVQDRSQVHALEQELDAGESEAIALTMEMKAGLLLMDERIGREVARHFGLHFTGLIGISIESRGKGRIQNLPRNAGRHHQSSLPAIRCSIEHGAKEKTLCSLLLYIECTTRKRYGGKIHGTSITYS